MEDVLRRRDVVTAVRAAEEGGVRGVIEKERIAAVEEQAVEEVRRTEPEVPTSPETS